MPKDAPDTRSLLQKAKDNFNANTQGAKPGDGALKGFVENVGAGGGDIVRAFAHLPTTVGNTVKQGIQDVKQGNDPVAMQAVRLTQGLVNSPGRTIGQLGTGAIVGEVVPPVIGAAVDAVKAVPEAISDAASAAKMRFRPTSDPAIVPPAEVQAQKIAQSILPAGGIKPQAVQSIQAEAPAIVEYAQRTGNPLNTQAEGLKAAQGVAKEGLDHFNTQILDPIRVDKVGLAPDKTNLGSSATLGQVSDEITALNEKVNTAKASNSGDALQMLEKSGVQDQLGYLRRVLYDNVSKKTGIPPDQLQTLREGYGGQFTVADALESAQNARLTRTGAASQGQQSISLKRPSVLELPGQIYQGIKGGEQAISDRQFSSAIKDVQPQAPARPLPNPPPQFPASVRGAPNQGVSTALPGTDYTPDMSAGAKMLVAAKARFSAARAAEAEAQKLRNQKRTSVRGAPHQDN